MGREESGHTRREASELVEAQRALGAGGAEPPEGGAAGCRVALDQRVRESHVGVRGEAERGEAVLPRESRTGLGIRRTHYATGWVAAGAAPTRRHAVRMTAIWRKNATASSAAGMRPPRLTASSAVGNNGAGDARDERI